MIANRDVIRFCRSLQAAHLRCGPRQLLEDVVIVASTLVGMLINFIGVSPIRALFWTAVVNGLLAPPLLVLIMLVSNNKGKGERVNSRWINALGWLTAAVMIAAAVGLLATWGRS